MGLMKNRPRCRYFNGPLHNKACKAGVNYRDLSGEPDFGWMARLPCSGIDAPWKKEIVICDKREEQTPDEIEKEETEIKERAIFLSAAIKDIRSTHMSCGSVVCPKCSGDLNFSVAKSNGHIRGKCTTEGCLSWMM